MSLAARVVCQRTEDCIGAPARLPAAFIRFRAVVIGDANRAERWLSAFQLREIVVPRRGALKLIVEHRAKCMHMRLPAKPLRAGIGLWRFRLGHFRKTGRTMRDLKTLWGCYTFDLCSFCGGFSIGVGSQFVHDPRGNRTFVDGYLARHPIDPLSKPQ